MSTAETSLVSPPPKLTFAERFRWLGIVANGALIVAMIAYLFQFPVYHYTGPAEDCFIFAFRAVVFTFPVGWTVFVQWRRVRDAWAGLFAPVVVSFSILWVMAALDPTTSPEMFEPPWGTAIFLKLYVLVFGLLWAGGVRLLDRKCMATSWQRGQFSLRTLVALTILAAAYAAAARDIATGGPFSQLVVPASPHQQVFFLLTSHVAIFAFAIAMSGYIGWSVILLMGLAFFGVSTQLRSMFPAFYVFIPKHWTFYVAMILFWTSAMTLPWVLIGWRVVWTPPLWDRSWRRGTTAQR